MKVICISASNVKGAGESSASMTACRMVSDRLVEKMGSKVETEIIKLLDYELKPCIMCGSCSKDGRCAYDEGYNEIFSKICDSDGVLIVCPHYASIPSKVMIILEKLQEYSFIKYCAGMEFDELKEMPIAIIAHGGQIQGFEDAYTNSLLIPLANAFRSIQMRVVGLNEEKKHGVVFGVEGYLKSENSVVLDMKHDWDKVENIIMPLVDVFADSLVLRKKC